MTRIVAIDPGLTGALARLSPGRLDVVDMPVVAGTVDCYQIAAQLTDWQPDVVVVEAQQAMPHQGVASTFRTGQNYGRLLGVIAALRFPVEHVTAGKWTRALGVGSDKSVHRKRAMDLWPDHAALFRQVKDDGRADAALIAWWRAKTEGTNGQERGGAE